MTAHNPLRAVIDLVYALGCGIFPPRQACRSPRLSDTCVILKRAVRLAMNYEDERILVLTFNRAPAQLIDELVKVCAPKGIRSLVAFKQSFVLCQERASSLAVRTRRECRVVAI